MIYTTDMNDGESVFVFGSNTAGRHGAGAALYAKKNWGAINGIGQGIQGMSYAIPTKGRNLEVLSLAEIEQSVKRFIEYASQNPQLLFLITPIGCGLAGYSPKDIAPMFKSTPLNCVLPDEFLP